MFAALLTESATRHWAILTACNPASQLRDAAANVEAQARLQQWLNAHGYRWLAGENTAEACDWPPERAASCSGLTVAAARQCGVIFGQNAVVTGDGDAIVFLVFLVVAGVETPLRIALAGEDVGTDAVEEPAVVRDDPARCRRTRAGRLPARAGFRRGRSTVRRAAGRCRRSSASWPGAGGPRSPPESLPTTFCWSPPLEVEAADGAATASRTCRSAGCRCPPSSSNTVLSPSRQSRGSGPRTAIFTVWPMTTSPESAFLPVIMLEQRGFAGAVRADDADDGAGRDVERQVVDQQAVAEGL